MPIEPLNYNYTSPISTTSGYQPIGVATARWLGMLAGDAEIDLGPTSDFELPISEHDRTLAYNAQLSHSFRDFETNQQHDDTNAIPANMFQGEVDRNAQAAVASEKHLWQAPAALTLEHHEQPLFDRFVTHISQWMDLFDPYKSFSSLVTRLALHNVGLLKATLTLSVRHHSLGARSVDQPSSAREDALKYYHETLHFVREAMQYKSYHTSLELLATTIIISAYEMLDGSSRDWERHLQGVFWIQRSQVIHGDSGGLKAAIWWAWLCQDFWAAFRDKRKVFTFWKPERTMAELNPLELAARSVFILGRVINYCVPDDLASTADGIASKLYTADSLSAMLDEWASYTTPEFHPLPHMDEASSTCFQSLWIYPPVFGTAPQSSKLTPVNVL